MERAIAVHEKFQHGIGEKLQHAVSSRVGLSLRHKGIVQVVCFYVSAVFTIIGCVMVITLMFSGHITNPDVIPIFAVSLLMVFAGLLLFLIHRTIANSEEREIGAHLRSQASQTFRYKKSLLPPLPEKEDPENEKGSMA